MGCASQAPVGQLRVFGEAFQAADAAAQPLIDDLALAERQIGRSNAVARAKGEIQTTGVGCPKTEVNWQLAGESGFIRNFCAPDAIYFATVSEPPATYALRNGMAVIGQYADVLLLMAEGRNIPEAEAQLHALSGNITALIGFIPGAQPYLVAFDAALQQLKPLIDAAAQRANDKEVKRLLVEGAPHVYELIDAMKDGAKAMFNGLTDEAAKNAILPASLDNPALAEADIQRIEAYRIGVSNYDVLLDELKSTLESAVQAVQADDPQISVAALASASFRLRTQAEAVRLAWARLRSGTN
jgi:hypothetical protein